jgi:midasin (ATPase involved in ribosome maturation)
VRCDLRVTFKEFEKLAATRARLAKAADEAEDELEDAEKEAARLITAAHELVAKARTKARRKRKELRFAENKEDGSYQRELAAIEAVRAMEQEASAASSSTPSVDDLLASSELLDFPDLGEFDMATLAASPFAWGQMTGSAFPVDTGVSEPSS